MLLVFQVQDKFSKGVLGKTLIKLYHALESLKIHRKTAWLASRVSGLG